jgi:predicted nucleic acid-binding protein
LSSSYSAQKGLRRLQNLKKSVAPTPRSRLPFLLDLPPGAPLLPDTTVYIDELQGKLPVAISDRLRRSPSWHSTVTEAELLALTGILDPGHPEMREVAARITKSIELRGLHRIVNPDRAAWQEAGIVSGALARLQNYGKAERGRALNDALMLCSATRLGLTVLTRNWKDFDLLQQMVPQSRAAFYEL